MSGPVTITPPVARATMMSAAQVHEAVSFLGVITSAYETRSTGSLVLGRVELDLFISAFPEEVLPIFGCERIEL
jgi:hypothetical protein